MLDCRSDATWCTSFIIAQLLKTLQQNGPKLEIFHNITCFTVGTPYNTVPYSTGSNITWLGHGSQKFVKQIVDPIHKRNIKSVPVRVIITWKNVPEKRIHGSADLSTVTPRSLAIIGVVVTLHWYDTIGIICCDYQSMAKNA